MEPSPASLPPRIGACPGARLRGPPGRAGIGALLALLLVLTPAPAAPSRRETTSAWWVFVATPAPASLPAAVRTPPAHLTRRALARRSQLKSGPVWDERDLDVSPQVVARIAKTGARIRHTSRWFQAVSVDATPSQLGHLRHMPGVLSVRPVAQGIRVPPPEPAGTTAAHPFVASGGDWPPTPVDYGGAGPQLLLHRVPDLHACGLDGSGVVVGVQDTGFDRTHEALDAVAVLAEHDFLQDDGNTQNETEAEVAAGQDAHGTMVLSLVGADAPGSMLGVAPGASFVLSKTEDVSQEVVAEEDHWVAGIEWQEAQGSDLVTSSLGYIDWYTAEDLDGATALTTLAATIAVEEGLIVLNAAGNAGPGAESLIAPADAAGVITVGAVDAAGTLADFSSRGPTADGRVKPDVVAVGDGNFVVSPGTSSDYRVGSGTSFATPITAGIVALIKQAHPEWGPAEVWAALTSTASHAGDPDSEHGYGVVDGLLAVGAPCTCADEDGDGHRDATCGGDDCDDAAAASFPGAPEVCDGADNDCDGGIEVGEADQDGDGANVCGDLDCDDADAQVHPGATEVCDGRDTDCDGTVPLDEVDADGDGLDPCSGGDCDDEDPAVFPAAEEACDGRDTDCDGLVPEGEVDQDGDGSVPCRDGDCDDDDAAVHPGATDVPYDGVDNDCDGSDRVDVDGDGQAAAEAGGPDCDDADPKVSPGAEEDCRDGIDNDCDGATDTVDGQDCPTGTGPGTPDGGCDGCVAAGPGVSGGPGPSPWVGAVAAGLALLRRRQRGGR